MGSRTLEWEMIGPEVEELIRMLARLPGLGPRSARRVALHLLTHRHDVMAPLAETLSAAADAVRACSICGNLDTTDPCGICSDAARSNGQLAVVEHIGDLWALDRTGAFRGRYHVLGGTLSALDGVGPDDLRIPALIARARAPEVAEVILALNATVDGQTTAHYIADRLSGAGVTVTKLAHGVPVGGEIDYLDDGTLTAALRSRRPAGAAS